MTIFEAPKSKFAKILYVNYLQKYRSFQVNFYEYRTIPSSLFRPIGLKVIAVDLGSKEKNIWIGLLLDLSTTGIFNVYKQPLLQIDLLQNFKKKKFFRKILEPIML